MVIVNAIILALKVLQKTVGFFFLHRALLALIGFFTTRKFPKAQTQHKYAVLVAARNEEGVISHLIESIRAQDYPSELVTVFVVADNCTDQTAAVARAEGAICYERTDPDHRTKGYALQYLVERISEDYGVDTFEGYFLFDADNLLKEDYISRMNEAFDAGEKIITSYRNTKNFGDNWISASYGIHWMRTIRTEHRARSVLKLATRIQGTGFLFASEIIRNGWHYTSLTEDRALSADAAVGGYRISYNHEAEFYDEQPVDIRIAMRQRIRWAKGHLQAFGESGGKLFIGIFRYIGRIRSAICFDMFSIILPRGICTVFFRWVIYLLTLITLLPEEGALSAAVVLSGGLLYGLLLSLGKAVLVAAYILFMERKHIGYIPWYKKIWFCLTFPLFDVIGRLAMVIALFTKVEWKPIPHRVTVGIKDVNKHT